MRERGFAEGENRGRPELLITPAFSGVIGGRLPIEISTRGARFAEGTEWSADLDEAAIMKLEATIRDLARGLAASQIEIEPAERRTT
ncbi:MAG: hypothetical protein ACTHK6_07820 [Solirubrobacterales bacterium]